MKLIFLALSFIFCFSVLSNSVTLPIEVLGKNGHIESIELNLKSDPVLATGLKLKIHGLGYQNKALVKINNSEWVPLNHTTTSLSKTQTAFWGMDGIMSTLDVLLPLAPGTLSYSNQISFRFNDLNKLTIGYRVLKIQVVSNNRNLDLLTTFIQDDPRNWKPIHSKRSDIVSGKEIWYNATLRDNGVLLAAKCSDCHAQDGRDLKYFNYSNKSIIERAKFHELDEESAKRIASYIRSLTNIPYQTNGRPWNPPYQPGLGIDSYPVENWAAGAGLGWVLDDDLKTLEYIFPNGPVNGIIYTKDGNKEVGPPNFKRTLNPREVPLAVQLPDWNHWLPEIHPKDAFPTVFTNSHKSFRIYEEARRKMLAATTRTAAAKVLNSSKSIWDRYAHQGMPQIAWEDEGGIDNARKRASVSHWRVVKTWELMTEFKVEEQGRELFGSASTDRRWFHGEIFILAPHMLKLPWSDKFAAESMQWYQLQLVLNDGNRKNPSLAPIDWGYIHALNLSAWRNPIDMPTYGIAILNCIKAGEVGENGIAIDQNGGWNPYRQHIPVLANAILVNQYKSIDINLRRRVAEQLLSPWVDKAKSYSREQFYNSAYWGKEKDGEGLKVFLKGQFSRFAVLGIDEHYLNKFKSLCEYLYPDEAWEK